MCSVSAESNISQSEDMLRQSQCHSDTSPFLFFPTAYAALRQNPLRWTHQGHRMDTKLHQTTRKIVVHCLYGDSYGAFSCGRRVGVAVGIVASSSHCAYLMKRLSAQTKIYRTFCYGTKVDLLQKYNIRHALALGHTYSMSFSSETVL